MGLKIMVVDGTFVIGETDSFGAKLLNPRVISFLEVDILDADGKVILLPSGEKKINTLIKMTALPGFPISIPIQQKCYTYDVNPSDNATIDLYKRLTAPTQPPVSSPTIDWPRRLSPFRGN